EKELDQESPIAISSRADPQQNPKYERSLAHGNSTQHSAAPRGAHQGHVLAGAHATAPEQSAASIPQAAQCRRYQGPRWVHQERSRPAHGRWHKQMPISVAESSADQEGATVQPPLNRTKQVPPRHGLDHYPTTPP